MEDNTGTHIRYISCPILGNCCLSPINRHLLRKSSRPKDPTGYRRSRIHRNPILPLILLQARRARPSNRTFHLRRPSGNLICQHPSMGHHKTRSPLPHRLLAAPLPPRRLPLHPRRRSRLPLHPRLPIHSLLPHFPREESRSLAAPKRKRSLYFHNREETRFKMARSAHRLHRSEIIPHGIHVLLHQHGLLISPRFPPHHHQKHGPLSVNLAGPLRTTLSFILHHRNPHSILLRPAFLSLHLRDLPRLTLRFGLLIYSRCWSERMGNLVEVCRDLSSCYWLL